MPNASSYGVRRRARLSKLIEQGIPYEEAIAQIDQEERRSVPIEERTTGGDPFKVGTITTPESEDAAFRQLPATPDQLPATPDQAGGQRNLRIMELLGNVGASFAQNRAVGKANKQTGQRQARSNLINTLRGANTSSVSPAEPKMGTLGVLAQGLGGAGRTLRESREAEAAGGQADFSNEIASRSLGVAETGARAKLLAALPKAPHPGDDEVKINSKLYRRQEDGSLKLIIDASDPTTIKADDGTIYEFDFDVLDDEGNKGAWQKLFGPNAEDISGLALLLEERGRQFPTMEALLEADPTLAAILNDPAQSDKSREILRGSFLKGNTEAKEDYEKALKKKLGSASERLTLAEAQATTTQLQDILELFGKAKITGLGFNLMNIIGIGFDPEENPLSQGFLRLWAEDSTQLADTLAGFTVNVARIINGGRPSNEDAKAARRLLPLQGESIEIIRDNAGNITGYGGLAGRKIMFLQQMFQRRVQAMNDVLSSGGNPKPGTEAARRLLHDNPGPSFLREAEDFLLQAEGNPALGAEAQTVAAETGLVTIANSNVGGPDD